MKRLGTTEVRSKTTAIAVLLLGYIACHSQQAIAGPDAPTITNGIAYFEGNQSEGVQQGSSSEISVVAVRNLSTDITPESGATGISFKDSDGAVIRAGEPSDEIGINTENASGIVAESVGDPGKLEKDRFLDVFIPGDPSTGGGTATVESYSDIITRGNGAHGIYVNSDTEGYSDEVIHSVTNFNESEIPFSFSVSSVDGISSNVGQLVVGTMSDMDGSYKTNGGAFILNAEGDYEFEFTNTLSVGESRIFTIDYDVVGTRADTGLSTDLTATLVIVLERTPDGYVTNKVTDFGTDSYGMSYKPSATNDPTVFPDLQRYVDQQEAALFSGGAGASVRVDSRDTIETFGKQSHGIYARSAGGQGADGAEAYFKVAGFLGFSSHWVGAKAGEDGKSGGDVYVDVNSIITTHADNSYGIFAESIGGTGGQGGEGHGPKNGGSGGTGGTGGNLTVTGYVDIATSGHAAAGIVAVSRGGTGGLGDDNGWRASTAGDGGVGGAGGNVLVTGEGEIMTSGSNSHGIISRSEGGKGGTGADGYGGGDGGAGGYGGTGGNTSVNGSWEICTTGNKSHGIYASSLGGTGGKSGDGGWFFGSGASGGGSGHGGNVSVKFYQDEGGRGGEIETFGAASHGIFAQSVGGLAGSGSEGGWFSDGGDGGSAGNGGVVTIENGGIVITHGTGSHALFAESIGGGGGDAGAGGLFSGKDADGDSSAGGHGGSVTVLNTGTLQTDGINSRAVFAQSVGGSGGNAATSSKLSSSIGGTGGDGGDGGLVAVTNSGFISTSGNDSEGIFAQSVGGGGGTGGGASSSGATIGGAGGGGGNGNTVVVLGMAQGSVETKGTNSHAIFAQSVGGGGGKGGYAFSTSGSIGFADAIAIGGAGGDGGDGGIVGIGNASDLTTWGDNANGIFAQSVGGGGGDAGLSVSTAGGILGAAGMSIGGTGGGGGNGAAVTVTNIGTINTYGTHSYGIQAQSVGGGGGNGGASLTGSGAGGAAGSFSLGGTGGEGGAGGLVFLKNEGHIYTAERDSHALFAQSVGGSGGSGGFSVAGSGAGGASGSVSIGGSGGTGGTAGNVYVESAGSNMVTVGDHAYGIFAQSVGGGGGDGGLSVAASGAGGASGVFNVGGSGGTGGVAGVVDIFNASAVKTFGNDSHAIFAQSVGGSGGSGGFSVAASGAGAASGSFGIGGSGGKGGTGGVVRVENQGDIMTAGERAYGLLAQSIGGTGGNGGGSFAGSGAGAASGVFTLGGSGGDGGQGGDVSLVNEGTVYTTNRDSHAIFVQSVGGSGGSGGFSFGASGAGAASGTASVGGSGGSGGVAGDVYVESSGSNIVTVGEHSYGILAQSIGGSGGDGGFSVAGSGAGGASGAFSLGGFGGTGGVAGVVNVYNTSGVTTIGNDSHALFAQSVGGSGGSGGFSVAASGAGGVSGTFGIGGFGGKGASGGEVSVTNQGSIMTSGERSYGLLAQSIGGNGGTGGGSLAGGGAGGASGVFTLGGFGGDGGQGGDIFLVNEGTVYTVSRDSHAVFAQSVGGEGGAGGFSIGAGGAGAASGTASVGGFGGNGGKAGDVFVATSGSNIVTEGEHAYGILAQSIGGSGGDGGFSVAASGAGGASGSFSLGGFGGTGAVAGAVNVFNSSEITTHGNDSHAVFAQSVGGSGGSGGLSLAGSGAGAASGTFGIGGFGGEGAAGGEVAVTNQGLIETYGERSYGMLAQSIGGTGGNGGASLAASGAGGASGVFTLGGFGGDGGQGGDVRLVNEGTIYTESRDSHAIFAQSVGGTGGSGGFSIGASGAGAASGTASVGGAGGDGGAAGNVIVEDSSSNIITVGEHAYGILAQSIGGSGGDGGFSLAGSGAGTASGSISVGGFGGNGATGGTVNVSSSSLISTSGDDAHAIFAQSVGGTGGSGGFSFAGSGAGAASGSVSLGGFGGVGGIAGDVLIQSDGSVIVTRGDHAYGILAQSIGGDGGDGGFSLAASGAGTASGSISVGGFGGMGASGGDVEIQSSSSIATSGDNSHAIFAQSVGGTGGSGSFSFAGSGAGTASGSISLGGFGGSGGTAGDVLIESSGSNILTFGEHAYGILAQSIGGDGGDGGFSLAASGAGTASGSINVGGSGGDGASGGKVSVVSSSGIATYGTNAHAIFAQSVGGTGGSGGFSIVGSGAGTASGSVGIGGFGGDGGIAGDVAVESAGSNIFTVGEHAYGILAQSVGGDGGDGGFSLAASGAGTASGSISVGGFGGMGASGGGVTVSNSSSIATEGNDSHAIFAQSVGGTGGSGGFSLAGSGAGTASGSISVGGFGGNGGTAGNIYVESDGSNIITRGEHSYGILAQSIGGSGGDGGFSIAASAAGKASGALTLGGFGGNGATGGVVNVANASDVSTFGTNAHAIFAQSVGGSGGSGGFSVAASGAGTASGSVSIGGFGGNGGSAGAVTVTNSGTIATTGGHAYGILAQSIGGSGGDGGFSVAVSGAKTVSAALSLGGFGGTGAVANAVVVDNSGSIFTEGTDSHAISAQSVGGEGGSGAFSVAGGVAGKAAVNAAIGGFGGEGGRADDVTVISTGEMITTLGGHSYGIHAQSVGGSGGDGGFSVAGGVSKSVSVNVAVGGPGGDGGAAGDVAVSNASMIATYGTNSHAVFAQSVGGGGGSGGFSVAGSIVLGSNGVAVAVGVGGSGGDGAMAGDVSVENSGDLIVTHGDTAYGILAQSVGGSGGSGGFNVAGGLSGAPSVNIGIGGSGGNGSSAGSVDIDSMSSIVTTGSASHAVFAQSVGGSGGAGSFSVAAGISSGAAIGVSFGGSGGSGGQSDDVTVYSAGDMISTSGERSFGILAQSMGGTGGSGGFSAAGGISKSASINFSMGGSGGSGGQAGNAAVSNASTMVTEGTQSHAIFAQSVGGGGGAGGFSVAGSVSLATNAAAVSVAIGGAGGNGAKSGDVEVESAGDSIFTGGDHSYGILAQSIGGSGGDGAFSVTGGLSKSPTLSFSMGGAGGNGGVAGNVDVDNMSSITTTGANSHAVFAQSVGGGGGSGGFSVAAGLSSSAALSASIGGSGGAGAQSGDVIVENSGEQIFTTGERSYGILAQSIGGTGGDGGFSVAGNLSTKSLAAGLSIGGSGAGGGVAGSVSVSNDSRIVTSGTNSHAIFAQSVGGSGGSGGFSVAGSISLSTNKPTIALSFGGMGGSGSIADAVEVISKGDMIYTTGNRSYGILAQSVGGGGGDGGFSVAGGISRSTAIEFSMGGFGGEGGEGDVVFVDNASAIMTTGASSHAIFAQSVGGGGGSGGFSAAGSLIFGENAKQLSVSLGGFGGGGGHSDNVTVINDGIIETYGSRAYGIYAQSVGGGGGDGGDSRIIHKTIALKKAESDEGTETNSTDKSWSLNLAIGGGGFAGEGGNGGLVSVTNNGSIYTAGDSSGGIFAQSVGGGGGAGGASMIDGAGGDGSENTSVNLAFTLGGFGGAGGDGDRVDVYSSGTIITVGDSAHGVMAQSVGGGGGTGGASVLNKAPVGSDSNIGIDLSGSIGGFGGVAGDADHVAVINDGLIQTFGEGSYGILAQSVGGGGGHGGDSTIKIEEKKKDDDEDKKEEPEAVLAANTPSTNKSSKGWSLNLTVGAGGKGGGGGDGGRVAVTNNGSIITEGDASIGIFAQSVGGGGGAGGANLMGGIASGGSTNVDISLAFGIGGVGGGGGSADRVDVYTKGTIITQGDKAHGIMAQSVGGGGGAGGASVLGRDTESESKVGIKLSGNIGGAGGNADDAGDVVVVNDGLIQTLGAGSYGILAQSVGGGGGHGGDSTIKLEEKDEAKKDKAEASKALLAAAPSTNKSSKGWNLNLTVGAGGTGAGGGDGGSVAVTNNGDIFTEGDSSIGIFAQSVGGGGGAGGANLLGGMAKGGSANVDISLAFGLGGAGGAGGSGDQVDIRTAGTIFTEGDRAHGIMAQSIGGGGGAGGASVLGRAEALDSLVGINLFGNVGGSGGNADDAGDVVIVNDGIIQTLGDGSYGILAQSIGGGGGHGGNSTIRIDEKEKDDEKKEESSTAALSEASTSTNKSSKGWSLNLAIGKGGEAGTGGAGGRVAVTNNGEVITAGDSSIGIFAQSVGGGGGVGGASIMGGVGSGGSTNVDISLSFGLGGSGGEGGAADRVDVRTLGRIVTRGDTSHGIMAQSVGGGGGTGGASAHGKAASGDDSALSVDLSASVGATGGLGGHGGDVAVANIGTVDTFGRGSYGILAQSIGGGGGHGGSARVETEKAKDKKQESENTQALLSESSANESSNSWNFDLAVGIGGAGGAAGDGGSVDVNNLGEIVTRGEEALGIFAQSVGGGGGVGGSSAMLGTTNSGGSGVALDMNVGLGGQGGGGGTGGAVYVENNGTSIITLGNRSHAIFAQSVGGGGGLGGSSFTSLDSSGESNETWQFDISTTLGAAGGTGGCASVVVVMNEGTIDTFGDGAYGISAQSIGGGGGQGGASLLEGGDAALLSFGLSLGGSGGVAGDGGEVDLTNEGDVITHGRGSHGIFAQSVGGGGGDAGGANGAEARFAQDVNIVVGGSGEGGGDGGRVTVDNSGYVATVSDGSIGIFVQSVGGGGGMGGTTAMGFNGTLAIGGAGGVAGDGSDVLIDQTGDVETWGVASHGIFAQSVGGGGGVAGNVTRGLTNLLNVGLGLAFGRDGGSSGDGGDVLVHSDGTILTRGTGANGIFAQSIGGGGGLGGDVGLGIGFAGSVGGVGTAGGIVIDHQGDIITLGTNAHGIFAQSSGGNGSAGDIDLTVSGNILALGEKSTAIFAQSIAQEGKGDISINILGGDVVGGSNALASILISEGRNNTLNNAGSIGLVDGMAIMGTSGNESIINDGIISGSVDLGDGMNSFVNNEGARFNSGTTINLGAEAGLLNAGTLAPGGSGNVLTSHLTGSFEQPDSGLMLIDISPIEGADLLMIEGTAELDGGIELSNLADGLYSSGMVFEVLVAVEGVNDDFDQVELPEDGPFLSFELKQDYNQVFIETETAEFSSIGGTKFRRQMASHMDRLKNQASDDLLRVLGALQAAKQSELKAAFESLSPAAHGSSALAAVDSARQGSAGVRGRMARMGSVGGSTPAGASGPYVGDMRLADGKPNGLWMGGVGLMGDQSEKDGYSGYEFRTGGFEIGYDRIFESRTILGASIGYANTGVDFDNNGGDSTIQSIGATFYGARQADAWYFEGILGYGNQRFESDRNVVVGAFNEVASSEHDGHLFSATGKVRYDIGAGKWKLSPLASLYWFHLEEEGFPETGAPGANLIVDSRGTDALLSELGARLMLTIPAGKHEWKPFLKLSWLHDFGVGDRSLTAAFEGAPNAPFTIDGPESDSDGALIGAGLYYTGNGRFSAGAGYDAELRESFNVQHIWGEVHMAF